MGLCWCGNENLAEYSENYWKCDKCHTLVSKNTFEEKIYDVKDEEKDLYGKNYWEVSMTKEAGKKTLGEVVDMYLTERVIYWLKYILKYVKLGADVAEVGCGLGQLQYVLKRLGYNQMAYEMSPDICSYIEKELGVQTHCGPFEEKKNGYDGILAFDLFEHLTDPLGFMQQCAESLREGGVLCFQTPCYDPQMSYVEMLERSKKFDEQLKADQHIYIYSKESMTMILKKFGFEHIVFEPAFFGDGYDMFFFASKQELSMNSKEDVNTFLDSVSNGRLLKAMVTLFEEKMEWMARYVVADRDRNERYSQIQSLEKWLKESEADRADRLEQVHTLEKLLKESEADRADRLKQIRMLEKQLREMTSSDQ